MQDLANLPQSPAVEAMAARLKAATVQVNEKLGNLPPSSRGTTLAGSSLSQRSQRNRGHSENREGPRPDGNPNPDGRRDNDGHRDNRVDGGNRNRGGGHGGRPGGGPAPSVNGPARNSDLRDHLNQRISLRDRIDESKEGRHAHELRHREEYECDHGDPYRSRAAAQSGLLPFTNRLRNIRWPRSFNVSELPTYNGKQDPRQWIMLYEIAVRAVGGSEDVMANYLPVVINHVANQWLLGLKEKSIDSWTQLKESFIKNFMATCQ